MWEAYFDASARDDGMFCLGGFLFSKKAAIDYAVAGVAYFFESGDENAAEAVAMLTKPWVKHEYK